MTLRRAAASLRPVTVEDTTLDAIIYVDERALLTVEKPVSINHTLTNPSRRAPEGNVWVPVLARANTRYGQPTNVRIYDLENMTYTQESLRKNLPLASERTFTGEKSEIDAFIRTYGEFTRCIPEPERERAKPLI